ncbi:MAG: ATP synthase F1 subunit epsilon [Coriobacteriia bacterium]|nr:ATP synthase F1 subunit epsilon [Coriobacteriia bacterium]
MATLHCEIVTPTKALYQGEVAQVEVPSAGGYAGILPGHETFCCRMNNGKITVYVDQEHKNKLEYASYMGFTQVHDDKVIILSREAILISEIDAAAVTAERDELQAKIDAMPQEEAEGQKKRVEKVQRNTLSSDLEWCNVQLEYCSK